jgi:hypothetical protein
VMMGLAKLRSERIAGHFPPLVAVQAADRSDPINGPTPPFGLRCSPGLPIACDVFKGLDRHPQTSCCPTADFAPPRLRPRNSPVDAGLS